jgi:hypothetical protein
MNHSGEKSDERGDEEAVEAIHQSPMTGDQLAGILGAEPAFDDRLE